MHQPVTHALAHLVDRMAVHHAVGAGEVDVFEQAGPGDGGGEGAQGLDPVLADHHHLAVFDIPHKARADDVQGAGFRGQHRLALEFAENQGSDAEGIAHPDQLLVGHRHQGVAALDLGEGVDEPIDHLATP